MSGWDKLMDPARDALEALIAKGDEMADRIEALTEQLAAARRDAEEAEAYAGELEADRKKTYEARKKTYEALLKVTRIHDEVEAKLAEQIKADLEQGPATAAQVARSIGQPVELVTRKMKEMTLVHDTIYALSIIDLVDPEDA